MRRDRMSSFIAFGNIMGFYAERRLQLAWALPIGFTGGITVGTGHHFQIIFGVVGCVLLFLLANIINRFIVSVFYKDKLNESYNKIIEGLLTSSSKEEVILTDLIKDYNLVDLYAWKQALRAIDL